MTPQPPSAFDRELVAATAPADWQPPRPDGQYNLERDPDEQHRITDEGPRATRLRQHLAAWAEANRRQYTQPDAR